MFLVLNNMGYVDFTALIQLGVVFNFAFIFEHLEPVKLFRRIFGNLNNDFKNSDQMIEHNITLLETSFDTLNIQENIKSVFLDKVKALHKKIDLGRANIEIRLNMTPKYFQIVCLFLAIYSILILFFIGDHKVHNYSLYAWPIFTFLSLLVIIYFFYKEILHFYSYASNQERISYVSIIFVVIFIFIVSYLIVYFVDVFNLKMVIPTKCINTINLIMDKLKYYSMFIPFVSFIVSFLLHSTSILYSKIKLFIYNKQIDMLSNKQNKLLTRKEEENCKLNF